MLRLRAIKRAMLEVRVGEEGVFRVPNGEKDGVIIYSEAKRSGHVGGCVDLVRDFRASPNWGSGEFDSESIAGVWRGKGEFEVGEGGGSRGAFSGRSVPEVVGDPDSVRNLFEGASLSVPGPIFPAEEDSGRQVSFGKNRTESAKVFSSLSSVAAFDGSACRNFGSCTTVFVNNIPPSTSAKRLKDWFVHFGSIVDVFIPKKRSKFRGCCFAFVRFRHEFEALQACEKSDGSTFDGFVLEVNLSKFPRAAYRSGIDILQGKNDVVGVRSNYGPDHSSAGGLFAVGVCSQIANSGVSYAQIVKAGGISNGVRQDKMMGVAGTGGTAKQPICLSEDPGHILAIMSCIRGGGAESIRPSLARADELLVLDLINPCCYPGSNGVSMEIKGPVVGGEGESKNNLEFAYSENSIQGHVFEGDLLACPSAILGCTQMDEVAEVSMCMGSETQESPLPEAVICSVIEQVRAPVVIPGNATEVQASNELSGSTTGAQIDKGSEAIKGKFEVTQEFINNSIGVTTNILDECRAVGIVISERDQRAIIKTMTKRHIQAEIDFYA